MNKKAVLLINVGSPESPRKKHVRKFLNEFLFDKRVLDIPWFLRLLLVKGVIVPFRTPKSSTFYKKLWTPHGSPIIIYSEKVKNKLQKRLGEDYVVFTGMCYGNPSLKEALKEIKKQQFNKLILFPLFPQYASSTTGSAVEFALNELSKWNNIPEIVTISQFYDHPEFISNWIENIRKYNLKDYDHILFSYHGLPLKHVNRTHNDVSCNEYNCTTEINDNNTFCYQAACYATTHLIVNKLGIKENDYTVCFQSRFAEKWLSPFTEDVLREKVKKGMKKLLVVSPSFVADCLETIVEIGIEYNELFLDEGGEKLQLVESLNDSDSWIDAMTSIILDDSHKKLSNQK